MPADLRIVNSRVVTPAGTIRGGVAVEDGKITAVGSKETLPEADEEIDAEQNHLIPGIICPHNHMGLSAGYENDYHTQFELDMETETRASLKGGVTSFFTFLLQEEPYMSDMDFFVDTGEEQSYIDFGFHAIIHQDHHVEEIEQLADDAGIRSFKLFFNMYKKSAPELGIGHSDAGRVYEVFRKTSDMGGAVVMFHAENDDLLQKTIPQVRDEEGRDSLRAWADSSPGIAQAMQVEQIGMLCEETDATAYVVHNSAKETIPVLKKYQDRGVQLYGETLPSFLANHCEDEDVGLWGKISPPIRYKEDQEALWAGLRTGALQHVGTDHCPYPREFKGERNGSFWEGPPGDQGLQTFLPLLLHEGVNKNRISMERLVETCSTNTAKRFGLYPRKGALVEGADADMLIVDLDKEVHVDSEWLEGLGNDWCSAYDRTLRGSPSHVITSGKVVVEDDEILTEKGIGEYLPRGPSGVDAA
ncbi:dihydroorotase [Haladaptatus sp. ZSTT2]|uniref:dihydroorotase n=1 Tax=Haladaptatus sp. ZSTT2 TaxID=3120515 RepID=UPI00300F7094